MVPITQLYNFSLVNKYKNCATCKNKTFNQLMNSNKAKSAYYTCRREFLKILFCRTNIRRTMLKENLPRTLSELLSNEIVVFALNCKKILKHYNSLWEEYFCVVFVLLHTRIVFILQVCCALMYSVFQICALIHFWAALLYTGTGFVKCTCPRIS